MLDKVTKACYSLFDPFCSICNKETFPKIKILKGFYQATLKKGRFNQLFKTNSFKPYL